MLAWLATNGSDNIAVVQHFGFNAGNGAGLQPSGILISGVATIDVDGSVVRGGRARTRLPAWSTSAG